MSLPTVAPAAATPGLAPVTGALLLAVYANTRTSSRDARAILAAEAAPAAELPAAETLTDALNDRRLALPRSAGWRGSDTGNPRAPQGRAAL